MDQDVIPHLRRHQDQTPVQGNVPVPPARSPSRPLVADAHARHRHPLLSRDRTQPRRQLRARPFTQRPPFVQSEGRRGEPRALPRDPVGVTQHERVRLAPRPAARNRHADPAVMLDAQQIPSRAAMADEINRCDRTIAGRCEGPYVRRCEGAVCRCERSHAGRCEGSVGGRCDRVSACRCDKRQIELHERQDNRFSLVVRIVRAFEPFGAFSQNGPNNPNGLERLEQSRTIRTIRTIY